MIPKPLIPQRLRGIATTILYANELYSRDPKLGPEDSGGEIYLGIDSDSDSTIRNTWVKLAEIKVKEITDEFAPLGTQTSWTLYFKRELIENEEVQYAYFVQTSHRKDDTTLTKNYWEHEEDNIGDIIYH